MTRPTMQMPCVKCPKCSHRWSVKRMLVTGVAAIRRSKVKKKAMKDATRRLKVDKAYEFMKDCEFAMNAVMAAMKAEECSKLNLAEKESSWRGLHPPPSGGG